MSYWCLGVIYTGVGDVPFVDLQIDVYLFVQLSNHRATCWKQKSQVNSLELHDGYSSHLVDHSLHVFKSSRPKHTSQVNSV